VFLGTYRGMTEVSEQIWAKLITSEPRFVPALLFQETVTNAVASAISIRWGFKGTNYAISSGNASGFQVLQLAVQALAGGRADAIVAGAFDLFTEANQHDMDDLGMLSPSNTSRPFDRRRDGFVMGEGAGVVLLETLARARARGATVLAEIAGVGLSHDAHGFGEHHPDGRGLAAAMRQALAVAALEPSEIDYVGAAANSTPGLDRAESRAIHSVFGAQAAEVPVSGLKAFTGEAMAASDMFNLAASIAAVGDGVAPVHPELERDPECALNMVGRGCGARTVRTALADSYSYFGGNAAAVVVKACAA
jgi:3-oxoacyl-(acyl-carrier-protein) synthase